jgi:hypothetical protein
MRIRALVIVAALVVGPFAGVLAQQGSVPQLDETNFSAAELRRLSSELSSLATILDDATLGPQRRLGQDGWTSESFATFTAGSLAERGYSVSLARNEARVWVLVGLVVGGRSVWVPVEPSPEAGAKQETLGRIPFQRPDSNSLRVDDRYLTFSATSTLPPDLSPSARVRTSESFIEAGKSFRLVASASDPDGQIVLYRWCIDGVPCVATTSWSYVARVETPGEVRILLVVVDSAGRSTSVETAVTVAAGATDEFRDLEGLSPGPNSGCGCGH